MDGRKEINRKEKIKRGRRTEGEVPMNKRRTFRHYINGKSGTEKEGYGDEKD